MQEQFSARPSMDIKNGNLLVAVLLYRIKMLYMPADVIRAPAVGFFAYCVVDRLGPGRYHCHNDTGFGIDTG